jgi:hypothetical protein
LHYLPRYYITQFTSQIQHHTWRIPHQQVDFNRQFSHATFHIATRAISDGTMFCHVR